MNPSANTLAAITSTDLVQAYNTRPSISKKVADRVTAFKEDTGRYCNKDELKQIVRDELSRCPVHLAKRAKHPLYNTHHQNTLIDIWDIEDDDGPAVPEKTFKRFTPWIAKHSNAMEDEVRDIADELSRMAKMSLMLRLGSFAEKFFREKNPTEATVKNLRRTLRAAFRQFNEQAAHVLKLVHKGSGQEYVSDVTKENRAWQMNAQNKWIKHSTVSNGEVKLALAACIKTAEQRRSELYTVAKGQESYFTSQGYVPIFATLTARAEYHPAPAYGETKWDGSSVADSHQWFNTTWQHVRADLAKYNIRLEGFRVTEPHKDGAEHWHMMLYVPKSQVETVKAVFLKYFGHSKNAVKFITDFAEAGKGKKGKASAVSYMLKYIIKTINRKAAAGTSTADDIFFAQEVDAAEAWRSAWGIRGFQFFGVLFGKLTLWRELRRLEEQPAETAARALWRASRGGRAHQFIALLVHLDPSLATIRETEIKHSAPDVITGETQAEVKKGRVIGVQINQVPYITHMYKWELETDYSLLNEPDFSIREPEVTVIHKCPRAGGEPSDYGGPPEQKHDEAA